jgi:hypothetical protein
MSSRARQEAGRRPRQVGTAGYSGTPLVRKLGIAAGNTVALLGEPAGFRELLAPLPDRVAFVSRPAPAVDITHLFAARRAELAQRVPVIRERMRDDAVLWVSWPKKASGVETDLTEEVVRQVALPLGLVDVKVCAVDDTWSGLKLVVRRELRRKV